MRVPVHRAELNAIADGWPRRLAVAFGVCGLVFAVNATAAGPVAVVGSTPISVQAYRHWAKVEQHASPRTSATARRRQVMDFLISNAWIEGEAAADGIVVTQQQVDQEFARIRRANYPSEKQFRRFLRQAGETAADVKLRTRIELLNESLQSRGLIPDPAKWKPQTRCAPAYRTSECGGTL